jgi:hypothetical protein
MGQPWAKLRNFVLTQAKKKNCSGNKWWELATKIENKMAPAF